MELGAGEHRMTTARPAQARVRPQNDRRASPTPMPGKHGACAASTPTLCIDGHLARMRASLDRCIRSAQIPASSKPLALFSLENHHGHEEGNDQTADQEGHVGSRKGSSQGQRTRWAGIGRQVCRRQARGGEALAKEALELTSLR